MIIRKLKSSIFTCLNRVLQLIYPIKIGSSEESIQYICNNKLSLCRFGEGEISLLARKQSLKFQKYDEKLAQRMKEILTSEDARIAIAIPLAIKNRKDLNRRAAKFWHDDTAYSMVDWVKYTRLGKKYLDSLMTRCYIDLKDRSRTEGLYSSWKEIWRNKNILIIEGKESRLGIGNDLFEGCKSIKRILCPVTNAFDRYDEILFAAQKQSKENLILIALGPTASVLAYDLAQCGYWALDVGHIDIEYEWYKMKAEIPTKVPGKYTNEVKEGNIVKDNTEKHYLEQIVDIID